LKETIKKQGNGIWKKSVKKDFWSYKRKRWYMENQTNDKLDELIWHKSIINHIKAQRLSWFGHLHRMPEETMVISIWMETDVNTTSRETKEQVGRWQQKWHEDTENKELD
jgi:hypothetical protein